MMTDSTVENMEQQLQVLYAERELLSEELGVMDASDVVSMVRNLESQLCDMYQTYGSSATPGSHQTMALLAQVNELSEQLDGLYSEKSIVLEMESDRPVFRAVWRETFKEGDD